jgi:hypothetical protein
MGLKIKIKNGTKVQDFDCKLGKVTKIRGLGSIGVQLSV